MFRYLENLISKDFEEEFKNFSEIKEKLEREENVFFKTLSSGMKILEQRYSEKSKQISGDCF